MNHNATTLLQPSRRAKPGPRVRRPVGGATTRGAWPALVTALGAAALLAALTESPEITRRFVSAVAVLLAALALRIASPASAPTKDQNR